MTDSESAESLGQTATQGQYTEREQQFIIQRLYLKDASFESPMGTKAFFAKKQPKVSQELGAESTKIDENLYETVLRLTLTAKLENETAFLVEVHQAGLFIIRSVNEQNLSKVLNTACPQILFPYARETVDSMLIKGSFPPVMLPPVNFEALFLQAVTEKKAKAH